MSEPSSPDDHDDAADLGLDAWVAPAPPAGLVDRVVDRVAAGPRAVAADAPGAAADRRSRAPVIAAALLGAVAAGAIVYAATGRGIEPAPARHADDGTPATAVTPVATPSRALRGGPSTVRDEPVTSVRRFPTPEARARRIGQIAEARALRESSQRAAGGGGGPPVATGDGPPERDLATVMDPAEIRASVREVIPLLVECFGMAAPETMARGGKVVTELVVSGEPDVGTVIEDAQFVDGDATMLADAAFTECMHETMLSVEMPPLAAGGKVTIRYPFVFSNDAPEDERADDAAKAAGADADYAALVDQAAAAAREGRYGTALRLADRALALRPGDQIALTAAAIAACNLKDAVRAPGYIAQLAPTRAAAARQVCLRHGVDVPLDR